MPTNARRRSRVRLLGITVVAGIALILLTLPQTARAQQNISVTCANPGDLQAAINSITNRTPATNSNVINVTGACLEAVTVTGFNNLMIQGPFGTTASITLPVTACGAQPDGPPSLAGAFPITILSSRNVTLRRLIITGGRGVALQGNVTGIGSLKCSNTEQTKK